MSIGRLGAAFVAGAGVTHFFDPQSGRRRRAVARDRLVHAVRVTSNALDVAVSDLAHRGHGVIAGTRGWLLGEAPTDEVLAERIRTRLGRVAAHPRAFDIVCSEGAVELRGDILESEAGVVLRVVRSISGVRRVDDHLTRHATADVPRLQGIPRRTRRAGLARRWHPATRLVVGSAGLLAGLYGLGARGPLGTLAALVGGGAVLRSVTNRSLLELFGLGPTRGIVSIHKTLLIHAPVERVYATWIDFEKFPRFMPHVSDVRRHDAGHYQWKVIGPAGVTIDWQGTVLEQIDGTLVRFEARTSASLVSAEGVVRFEPRGADRTKMSIEIGYTPPLGEVGHSLASLLGFEPKHEIDDDLLRFKSLLEHGKARGRNGVVTSSELSGGTPVSRPS